MQIQSSGMVRHGVPAAFYRSLLCPRKCVGNWASRLRLLKICLSCCGGLAAATTLWGMRLTRPREGQSKGFAEWGQFALQGLQVWGVPSVGV